MKQNSHLPLQTQHKRNGNISLDRTGICIDGKYQILLVSSLFYFRIPMSKWDERMKELKSAGYNAIDVYFPWNYHEIFPGEWNFQENRNVELFLEIAKQNKMFVIARPGPYICSEWDGGGIPAWYTLQNFKLRQNDDAYIGELSLWYGKILPLIKKYQWSEGGSVLLLQVENELDYFLCTQPDIYISRLTGIVRSYGIEIPLIICCGQDDIEKSGGNASEVKTAFNIYAEIDNAGLEERTSHLYGKMQDRNQPLMVTETNREHSFLKRLLGCGAKMIAPYNQTAGTTMDYYNAITNWGKGETPLSLLTSDYDFNSMIGPDGTLLKEAYIQARLLGGLIFSLGEELALAVPHTSNNLENTLSTQILQTTNGSFRLINNLNNYDIDKVYFVNGESFSLHIPSLYTVLLPMEVTLSKNCRLEWTNCELAWLCREKDSCQAALYGYEILKIKICVQGQSTIIERPIKKNQTGILIVENCTIYYGEPEQIARSSIPGISPWCLEKYNEYTERQIKKVMVSSLKYKEPDRLVQIMEMEKLGQYRGCGSYEFELNMAQKIQFSGLTDIITIFRNGHFWKSFYGDGREWLITLPEGKWQFRTEIWGHCNFEDIRVESLKLGSLKGIRKICRIFHEDNISDNWEYGERPDGYKLLIDIDKYNIPLSPVIGFYRKKINLPKGCDRFSLFFSQAKCQIQVRINGQNAGEIQVGNPCLDITPYTHKKKDCTIELKVCRRYYAEPVGEITLCSGIQMETCKYQDITFTGTDILPKSEVILPISIPTDEELIILPQIPEQGDSDIKLYLKGKNVFVTILCNGHIAGRLLLECENMPTMAGGSPNEVFLCQEWLQNDRVIMKCQALQPNARLDKIVVKENLK